MKLNLKHRHLLTSTGNIRMRYVVIIGVLFLGLCAWIFSGDNSETETYVAYDCKR